MMSGLPVVSLLGCHGFSRSLLYHNAASACCTAAVLWETVSVNVQWWCVVNVNVYTHCLQQPVS
jgi:hypothetical protein